MIHGKTQLKVEANGVPHQQLPLNVHRNTKLLHMDKDKGDDDFQVELQSFNIYETLVDGFEKEELNLYEPGQYCVLFNENKEYIATFHSKVTLVENIDVIDISNEAYKHAISAIIGGLIIAGIVAKYQITGLSNISPISARIFSLLVVYFGFNSVMMILNGTVIIALPHLVICLLKTISRTLSVALSPVGILMSLLWFILEVGSKTLATRLHLILLG